MKTKKKGYKNIINFEMYLFYISKEQLETI